MVVLYWLVALYRIQNPRVPEPREKDPKIRHAHRPSSRTRMDPIIVGVGVTYPPHTAVDPHGTAHCTCTLLLCSYFFCQIQASGAFLIRVCNAPYVCIICSCCTTSRRLNRSSRGTLPFEPAIGLPGPSAGRTMLFFVPRKAASLSRFCLSVS